MDIGFCIHAATEVIGHPQRQNLAEIGRPASEPGLQNPAAPVNNNDSRRAFTHLVRNFKASIAIATVSDLDRENHSANKQPQ
jgi:hypothetical protein